MIATLLLALLSVTCQPSSAFATPLVADLSNYRIDMDSSFNGTRLFLFGARNDNGDIVVVVRGPQKNYIVRKKENIAGIWVNRKRVRFWNLPDFYAIAASKPLREIEQKGLFKQLRIGLNSLLHYPQDDAAQARYLPFAEAFIAHQQLRQLYTADDGEVQFMGETLFKTTIEFPDDIPPGDYTAEIYLVSDGDVVGMQSTPIRVNKTGIEAFLYMYAHDYPAFYGLTAVVLALAAGWFAGRLFEKT